MLNHIRIGDEVIDQSGFKYFVTYLEPFTDGSCGVYGIQLSDLLKIGREAGSLHTTGKHLEQLETLYENIQKAEESEWDDSNLRPATADEMSYCRTPQEAIRTDAGFLARIAYQVPYGDKAGEVDDVESNCLPRCNEKISEIAGKEMRQFSLSLLNGLLASANRLYKYFKNGAGQNALITSGIVRAEPEYGLAAESQHCLFLMRYVPADDNGKPVFDCLCYLKQELQQHIIFAKQGVKLIDKDMNTLLLVKDGAVIKVKTFETENGFEYPRVVFRYADAQHLYMGTACHSYPSFASTLNAYKMTLYVKADDVLWASTTQELTDTPYVVLTRDKWNKIKPERETE